MNDKRRAVVIETIKTQIVSLIHDHEGEIFEAYERAFRAHEGDGKFTFPVGLRATITPIRDGFDIESAVTVASRSTFKAEDHVPATPDMFTQTEG